MRFHLEQTFAAPLDAVALAFTEPELYAALGALAKLGRPEVLDRSEDGDQVHLQVRYWFAGNLSAAARRVVDPARLSWVECSTHDLARHQVDYIIVPDHYAHLLSSSGCYAFRAADGGATVRQAEGEVSVRVPLVGGAVERAIVSGIEEHLSAEIPVVERYLTG